MSSPILEVIDLKKQYKAKSGTADAVKGISFHVNRSEIFGFLGANGAGILTYGSLCQDAGRHPGILHRRCHYSADLPDLHGIPYFHYNVWLHDSPADPCTDSDSHYVRCPWSFSRYDCQADPGSIHVPGLSDAGCLPWFNLIYPEAAVIDPGDAGHHISGSINRHQ